MLTHSSSAAGYQWVLSVSPTRPSPHAQVFVMCEDEALRRNRLALLRDLAGITAGLADLSQLPGF